MRRVNALVPLALLLAPALAATGATAAPVDPAEPFHVPAGETKRIADADLVVPGGVVVEGTLELVNARLVFAQDPSNPGSLVVANGGRLVARNATITTVTDRLATFPWLNVTIDNAVALFEDTVLQFPTTPLGDPRFLVWIHASNVEFTRSVLKPVPREALSAVAWRGGYSVPDEADDGPLVVAHASHVVFREARVESLYETAGYNWTRTYPGGKGPLDDTGSSTHVFFNGATYRVPPGATLHLRNFTGARGAQVGDLRMAYATMAPYAAFSPVLLKSGERAARVGSVTPSAGENELRVDLSAAGFSPATAHELEILFRNEGSGDVLVRSLTLDASWRPRESNLRFSGGSTLLVVDSFLDVDWRDGLLAPGQANHLEVGERSRAFLFNATFDDAETKSVRSAPALIARDGGEVVIIRRLDVLVKGPGGRPLEGAVVRLDRPGFDPDADERAWRVNAEFAGLAFPFEEGRSRVTGPDGVARFAVASDLLAGGSPDGRFLGQYVLNVSAFGGEAVERLISLPIYPRVGERENHVRVDVDASALFASDASATGIRGLSAFVSRDGSKILVTGRVLVGNGSSPLRVPITVGFLPVESNGDTRAVNVTIFTDAEGQFVAEIPTPSTGKYGVVASMDNETFSALTVNVNAPGPLARFWGAVPLWLLWSVVALVGGLLLVIRFPGEAPAKVEEAGGTAVLCGHCERETNLETVGCFSCGALFTGEDVYCGGCGGPVAAGEGPCPSCRRLVTA